MMNLEAMPILEGLLEYETRNRLRFHMPGHKGKGEGLEELDFIKEHLYAFDLTEVEGTDSLHAPKEMIARAQERLAEAYGAVESRFLVNGSTSGIYAAILGVTRREDLVLVQRNCHQSVHTALEIGGLRPVYLFPQAAKLFGFASGVSLSELRSVWEANPGARAVILTYPSYYGSCCDLRSIADFCREKSMLLIVDEAHGAHFPFHPALPPSALACGADVSVNSFHKTLPAFTQTAVLHMGESLRESCRAGIRRMLSVFQSSSPSYLFLASMDAARWIMQSRGRRLLDELKKNIEDFERRMEKLPFIRLLSEGDLPGERKDFARLVIKTPLSGQELAGRLRESRGVEAEMAEGNVILLIASVMDEKEDFDRLAQALFEIFAGWEEKTDLSPERGEKERSAREEAGEKIQEKAGFRGEKSERETSSKERKEKKSGEFPGTRLFPRVERILYAGEVSARESEEILWKEAVGRVAAEKITPYPPGVPLLLPGERISEEILFCLKKIKEEGRTVLQEYTEDGDRVRVLNVDL
ncbi:MAG: aminotransferase class I/II-fold pyridoxal phosphate-dependent enzyme [Peptostreptococcaceae bacterium]|nr:aminotransferase class I/II-fold pyridoxal phosphate-dependent enzyme [Peptostreptococcaceae bacterium]